MAQDVSCAFLYAKVHREIHIELPAEDPLAVEGKYVGRLKKALYGTRDAPQLWQKELGSTHFSHCTDHLCLDTHFVPRITLTRFPSAR